jgi:hypothetical protein
MSHPLEIAVITGGHPYQVQAFDAFWKAMPGINAVIQNIDDFTASPEEVRDSYSALVFFFMPAGDPEEDDAPWFAGNPKAALEHLGSTEQGIVVLHHAILAFRPWSGWADLCALPDRAGFSFAPDEIVDVKVANPNHPITMGMDDWQITDEVYKINSSLPAGECDVLMTTDHPKSMQALGWTRMHGKSRVFCFQPGHDSTAWSNPVFAETLRRGIQWTAGNL